MQRTVSRRVTELCMTSILHAAATRALAVAHVVLVRRPMGARK
jgi:hypothetical protein